MMNISMNFNMNDCVKNIIDKKEITSLDSNEQNLFEKIILDINESHSLLNEKTPDLGNSINYNLEDLESSISSFEELLTKLFDENKEVNLEDEDTTNNENVSFLQNIVSLIPLRNDDLTGNLENLDATPRLDKIDNNLKENFRPINLFKEKDSNPIETLNEIQEGFNYKNISIENKEVNNKEVINKEVINKDSLLSDISIANKELNTKDTLLTNIINNSSKKDLTTDTSTEHISKEDSLILEFTESLTNETISSIEKLEDNSLKKDILSTKFKEFLTENYNYNKTVNLDKNKNIDIDGFYNGFKTVDKTESKNIKTLNSNELIDFLSNRNISTINENVFSDKTENSNFILHKDNIAKDLQSSILFMKNSQIKQLKLKLTPKELGELTIDISQIDSTSNITLTISNKDTLSLIQSNLSDIINNLKEMNLISDESTIVVQSNNQNETPSNFNSFSSQQNKGDNQSKVHFDIDSSDNLDNNIDIKRKTDSKLNILA